MHLYIVLLISIVILCITKVLATPLTRLDISTGYTAFLMLALLVLQRLSIHIIPEFTLYPAAILLPICVGSASGLQPPPSKLLQAALLAFLSAAAMTLLRHLLSIGRLHLPEPGLFLGIAAVPLALLLHKWPSAAFLSVTLAPLLMAIMEVALEAYAFGYAVLELGAPLQMDAQMTGLCLVGLFVMVEMARKEAAQPDALY